jgi:hypothetical protein
VHGHVTEPENAWPTLPAIGDQLVMIQVPE